MEKDAATDRAARIEAVEGLAGGGIEDEKVPGELTCEDEPARRRNEPAHSAVDERFVDRTHLGQIPEVKRFAQRDRYGWMRGSSRGYLEEYTRRTGRPRVPPGVRFLRGFS